MLADLTGLSPSTIELCIGVFAFVLACGGFVAFYIAFRLVTYYSKTAEMRDEILGIKLAGSREDRIRDAQDVVLTSGALNEMKTLLNAIKEKEKSNSRQRRRSRIS